MTDIRSARLLVVDDEPDLALLIRHAFRRQIRTLDWHFEFAHNGEEALRRVRERPDFDALLTDINMPVMDGLTLLRELDTLDGDMKVVVISAYGDMDNIRRAMQLGAIDFVTKPIDLSDLENTVNKVLSVVLRLKAARRTEIEKAQAVAASEAKSQFLADISHELRTPLHAIIMYSELILEEQGTAGSPDLVRDVGQIRSAGKHLMTLINDLLDYSKLQAGRMPLHAETFAVAALTAELEGMMRAAMKDRGNLLEVAGGGLAGDMHADLTRVRQCLLNLLSNAGKFTEQGLVTLSVVREEATLVFTVTDTGIGMSPEQMGRIFQRYEQAEGSTGRVYGGTGLGLAITSQLCDVMGGSIKVESAVGRGSVFTIRWPSGLTAEAPV